MRLWSLHPGYLDPAGLVALWREALLAQKVLAGRTRGYRRHPQLDRFKAHPHPRRAIAQYLCGVHDESVRRGYRFDRTKIGRGRSHVRMPIPRSALRAEFDWLLTKLRRRSPSLYRALRGERRVRCHASFRIVNG